VDAQEWQAYKGHKALHHVSTVTLMLV
jgi:hypothetical protein